MMNTKSIEQFSRSQQTDRSNVIREYFQHLFLSYLYRQEGSERVLFKGGTALRIVFGSPRFSEDLDFTGVGIASQLVETLFTGVLAAIELTGVSVKIIEGKPTTGGYIGIASFAAYDTVTEIRIEVSFRDGETHVRGTRALIENEYLPAYTLVHLPKELLVKGKLDALRARHKPRDFFDYYFLLSGNFPAARDRDNLKNTLEILRTQKIDFKNELKKFLPASHASYLKDFKKILEQKIESFL